MQTCKDRERKGFYYLSKKLCIICFIQVQKIGSKVSKNPSSNRTQIAKPECLSSELLVEFLSRLLFLSSESQFHFSKIHFAQAKLDFV